MLKKILTMILLSLLVPAVAAFGVLLVMQQRATSRSFVEQQSTIIRFAKDNIELGLAIGSMDSVKKTLNQLETYSIFEGAVVFDVNTGILTMPTEFEAPPWLLNEARVTRNLKVVREDISYETQILRDQNGEVIGSLMIAFSLDSVKAENRRTLIYSAAVGCFILLPVMWIVVCAITKMLRPVEYVKNVLHAVAAGDLTQRIDLNFKDEFGEIASSINQAVDKLRDVFEEAKVACEAKSEFLANMSHEIRTPLTAILGYSDILGANLEKPEDIESIEIIRRNSKHLLELINDILDLSKIESRKLELERIAFSPASVVDDVKSLMRMRAEARGLSLEIEYVGGIPERIQSDPIRLRQILINLVGNAIKFTETGSVRLVTRLEQGTAMLPRLQFDVIDTGIGMTQEQASKLFEPFTQADASTTRKFGGTGLGLAISKRLVERLGGDIMISTSAGKGSTFSVRIETGRLDNVSMLEHVTEAMAESKRNTKAPAAPAVSLDYRLLLAEDGADNQRLISFVLKKAGADVTVAENGLIAHDKALAAREAGEPFHVILMDMQMPVMDGYTATRKLRDADYAGPIIALTANAMAGDEAKCVEAGCDGYATKPIDRPKLIAMIALYAAKQPQGLAVGNDAGGVT